MDEEEGELCEYELKRKRNIERNRKLLGDLGFGATHATLSPRPKAKKKRLEPQERAEPIRRSSRVMGISAVDYSEVTTSSTRPSERKGLRTNMERPNYSDKDNWSPVKIVVESERKPQGEANERPPPAPDSTRSLDCNVDALLGDWVGQKLESNGKQAVVDLATLPGPKPRFSKYAGMTEWRNAVFLWVNVGGADYNNLFENYGAKSEGGGSSSSDAAELEEIEMTWFAGSRQTEESPAIQRLLKLQTADTAKGAGATSTSAEETETKAEETAPSTATSTSERPAENILLFCRVQGEPYVFCGRLAYRSHVPNSQPLRFVWALKDSGALRSSEKFQELLAAQK